jgi:hypothetical protein
MGIFPLKTIQSNNLLTFAIKFKVIC